jgi:hypothetical protein
MAKISSNQTILFGSHHRVYYDVHYVKEKGYSSRGYGKSENIFFFAQPHKQDDIVHTHALVKSLQKAGKKVYGFEGTSEIDAVAKLKAYYTWYVSEGMKKEKLIGIRNKEERYFRDDEKGTIKVMFDYVIAEKVTAGKNVSYIPDSKFHKNGWYSAKEEKDSSVTVYTWVPYTKELEKQCEEIVARLKEIQKKIFESFATPETAMITLNSNKLLNFAKK